VTEERCRKYHGVVAVAGFPWRTRKHSCYSHHSWCAATSFWHDRLDCVRNTRNTWQSTVCEVQGPEPAFGRELLYRPVSNATLIRSVDLRSVSSAVVGTAVVVPKQPSSHCPTPLAGDQCSSRSSSSSRDAGNLYGSTASYGYRRNSVPGHPPQISWRSTALCLVFHRTGPFGSRGVSFRVRRVVSSLLALAECRPATVRVLPGIDNGVAPARRSGFYSG